MKRKKKFQLALVIFVSVLTLIITINFRLENNTVDIQHPSLSKAGKTNSGKCTIKCNAKLSLKNNIKDNVKYMPLNNYSIYLLKDNKEYLNITNKGYKDDNSYLINSVQKSLTAAMIAKEVEKGKVQLTDTINKWFPLLKSGNKVTVKQLINMTSGLNTFEQNYLTDPYKSDDDDITKHVANTYIDNKEYGSWKYNSLNYIYLSAILEKITHKSYENIFKANYIKPLKLRHTAFYWDVDKNNNIQLRLGKKYNSNTKKYEELDTSGITLSTHHLMGAGSIVMSNADLAKAINYILSNKYLNTRSKIDIFNPVANGSIYNGGFYNLKDCKEANGAGNGYQTFLRCTNDGKTILVVQSNTSKKGTFATNKKKINQIWNFVRKHDK